MTSNFDGIVINPEIIYGKGWMGFKEKFMFVCFLYILQEFDLRKGTQDIIFIHVFSHEYTVYCSVVVFSTVLLFHVCTVHCSTVQVG